MCGCVRRRVSYHFCNGTNPKLHHRTPILRTFSIQVVAALHRYSRELYKGDGVAASAMACYLARVLLDVFYKGVCICCVHRPVFFLQRGIMCCVHPVCCCRLCVDETAGDLPRVLSGEVMSPACISLYLSGKSRDNGNISVCG